MVLECWTKMTQRNDTASLLKLGQFYKQQVGEWIRHGRFDEQWYKDKTANILDARELAVFHKNLFRAAVLQDFWKFTYSISDVIDRNDKYVKYIDRIDKENIPIGTLDRKIVKIENIKKDIDILKSKVVEGTITQRELNTLKELEHRYDGLREKYEQYVKERAELRLKRPVTTLCMIPRGLLKTTIFQAHRALWYYLRDAVHKNQSPIIFLLHSVIDKANETLSLIKDVADLEHIKFAFGDKLQRTVDRVNRLSFNDISNVMRKEDHFITGSVGMDFGGEHGTYYFVDDAVLETNTDTEEKSSAIKKWFHRLTWLNDHSGDFRIEMVGTHYWDDSLYVDLSMQEECVDIVTWIEGASSRDEDGNIVLNFPEVYDQKSLDKLKRTSPAYQYMSQVEMIQQKRVKLIDIIDGIDYIFNYDEEFTLDFLLKNGVIVTSKDPSYSTVNKKEGDGKSRDTTITGVIYHDCFYVIDEHQLFGGDTETIAEPLIKQVRQYQSDIFICDAQGTQKNYAIEFYRMLKNDTRIKSAVKFIPYTKPKQNNTIGKASRASVVLSEWFRMGKIKVNSSCYRMIDELERRTKGYDFLDCLLMVTSIDFVKAEKAIVDNKRYGYYNGGGYLTKKKWGVHNATTGY